MINLKAFTKNTVAPGQRSATFTSNSPWHKGESPHPMALALRALIMVFWLPQNLDAREATTAAASPKKTKEPTEESLDGTRAIKERLGISSVQASPPVTTEQAPPAALEPLVQFAAEQKHLEASPKSKVDQARIGLEMAHSRFGPVALVQAQKSLNQAPRDVGTDKVYGKSSSVGITVRQNIWNGGQDLINHKQQTLALEWAQLQAEDAQKNLHWRVRLAGLQYYHAAINLWIAEHSLKNSQEIVHLSEQKSKAGQVGKIDLMQSQQQLSEIKTQAATAEMRLSRAQENLETLLLLPPSDPRHPALVEILRHLREQTITRPERSWLSSQDPDTWLEGHFLWKSKQNTILQKDLENAKARRNRWLPTVDLTLSYQKSFEPRSQGTPLVNDEPPINAGINLNWPLWDQPQSLRIEQTAAEAAAERLQAEETERTLRLKATQTKGQLERLLKLFAFHQTTYEQSEALYQAKIQLYRAGAIDIITLTNAANDRLRSIQSISSTMSDLQQEWLVFLALKDGISLNALGLGGSP